MSRQSEACPKFSDVPTSFQHDPDLCSTIEKVALTVAKNDVGFLYHMMQRESAKADTRCRFLWPGSVGNEYFGYRVWALRNPSEAAKLEKKVAPATSFSPIGTAVYESLSQLFPDTVSTSFAKIIDSLRHDCAQTTIQTGKSWITENITTPPALTKLCSTLTSAVTTPGATYELKLHVLYLLNDVLYHAHRKGQKWMLDAFIPHLLPLLSQAYHTDPSKKDKLEKVGDDPSAKFRNITRSSPHVPTVSKHDETDTTNPNDGDPTHDACDETHDATWNPNGYGEASWNHTAWYVNATTRRQHPSRYDHTAWNWNDAPWNDTTRNPTPWNDPSTRRQHSPRPPHPPVLFPTRSDVIPPLDAINPASTPAPHLHRPPEKYHQLPAGLMVPFITKDTPYYTPLASTVRGPTTTKADVKDAVDAFYAGLESLVKIGERDTLEEGGDAKIDKDGWEVGFLDGWMEERRRVRGGESGEEGGGRRRRRRRSSSASSVSSSSSTSSSSSSSSSSGSERRRRGRRDKRRQRSPSPHVRSGMGGQHGGIQCTDDIYTGFGGTAPDEMFDAYRMAKAHHLSGPRRTEVTACYRCGRKSELSFFVGGDVQPGHIAKDCDDIPAPYR
ncbi:hypothetical protein BC829DRAFT_442116 [Chytridium lagenaria]|nr:hypothetical protein BC829DRAFT_442116 [Chytridium lagenaria]